jgi:hypothetical protein
VLLSQPLLLLWEQLWVALLLTRLHGPAPGRCWA